MTSWQEYHQYELENGGMDDPPYCPLCGVHTGSGVLCEKCRDEDPGANVPDVCHCGLAAEEHTYPRVDHNFVAMDEPSPAPESEEAAFVRAIVAAPHDAAPRLVFADWLDDHGQPERAAAHRKDRTDSPPCRGCGLSDKVLCFPDNQALAVCPDCCDKAEHPDGETGHKWEHDQWERGRVCVHCGIPRRYTDYDQWEYEGDL